MFDALSKKCFLIVAIFVLATTTIIAQGTASISGTITDSSGAVVVGATVKALNIGSSRETTATTDAQGKFEIKNLSAGSYRISAVNSGFAESAENVRLEQGASVTQDFSLNPGTITDVVTVTAGKGSARIASEVPQTVTVTTADDIEKRLPRSTFEAIERAPSVVTVETNPARARPRLRGLDSSRVLIVIDGERLNNARTDLNTGLSPSIVDVSQLESAEVVAGSGSSLYGSDSLAGTINLITKGPVRPDEGILVGARFDGSYASNGALRRGTATLNLSNEIVAFRASATMFRNANYNMGNEPITLAQTRAIGDFYLQFPGNNAQGFPLFSVPAGGEILNGAASGFNKQFDMWFYPTEKHSFRGRFLGNDHSNLGNAFSGPPYETQERFNAFRDYKKWGLRYEGTDINKYIPRVSINFYHQKLAFPQDNYVWSIQEGSSYEIIDNPPPTPDVIQFVNPTQASVYGGPVGFTSNGNSITTNGFDAQATFQPVGGLLLTTGYQYLRDDSQDNFNRYNVNIVGRNRIPDFSTLTRGASSPNTIYEDNAVYMQAEFDRIKWLRLIGGFRIDNWATEAKPTQGFPLGLEFLSLQNATPFVTGNPGPFTSLVPNLQAFTDLASGTGSLTTSNTIATGNLSAVFRLPYGINPYIRYATSYREPALTERYLLRDFVPKPSPVTALVVGNPGLEPETGKNVDVGIKVQGDRYSGSFGYFHNTLDNLIVFADQTYFVPAQFPFLPLFPNGPHLLSFNARINQSENVIKGYEAIGEVSIPLGSVGSLNPFTSMSWLHGENKSPTQTQLDIIASLYNRSDTLIPLEGSADDVPLRGITPFRTISGVQFTDAAGKIFIEYSFRHQARVKRANPTRFTGGSLINIGTFLGLNSFTTHSIKGGYNWRTEKYKFSINAGIDNLADKFYVEHFQTAPAPGRSFVIGTTIEVFNFFDK